MKKKLTAYHNGSGWTGVLSSEAKYRELKREEADWKPNVKRKMIRVEMPTELFYRLMNLDDEEYWVKEDVTVRIAKRPAINLKALWEEYKGPIIAASTAGVTGFLGGAITILLKGEKK